MKKSNINFKIIKKKINGLHLVYVIVFLMLVIIISKSYAIYKLEEKYNIMESKIDTFSKPDILVAANVDGKEADEFPSYETNYKVESIDCTNGVVASWDIENWELRIADMNATSTKCTINFDSTKTNTTKPINMSKSELLALNEDIKTTSARTLADYLYPVGSIYMSTEDDTVNKVEEKFGGTWVRYSSSTTLVGYDATNEMFNEANKSGGSSTTTLEDINLPTHYHTIPELSVSTWSGSHSHTFKVNIQHNDGTKTSGESLTSGLQTGGRTRYNGKTDNTTVKVSGQTTTESQTTTCTNCTSIPVNVQNPYTVVYIYKRTA